MTRNTVQVGCAVAVLCVTLWAGAAAADCTTGSCIPGGGNPDTDCAVEFFGSGLLLNYPFSTPAKQKVQRELRCFDGDAGCDADGAVDGTCTFSVNLCLLNTDPNLPTCTAPALTGITVTSKRDPSGAAAIQAANLK